MKNPIAYHDSNRHQARLILVKNPIAYHDSNRHQARLILEAVVSYGNHRNLPYSEVKEAIQEIQDKIIEGTDDYQGFEFDGNEYRIISDSSIWGIYKEEIKNSVTDCYELKLDKIPSFVAVSVDWEQTAQNAFVDGYGHTFSGYDGNEEESSNGYWVFRTN